MSDLWTQRRRSHPTSQELERRIDELEALVLYLTTVSMYVGDGGSACLENPWRSREVIRAYRKKHGREVVVMK